MNYSKLLMLCLGIQLVAGACQNTPEHDGYTINGTVRGIDNVYIKMAATGTPRGEQAELIDSALVSNGHFTMKGKVQHTDLVALQIDSKSGLLFLENSEINVEIDLTGMTERDWSYEPKVSGSASHQLYSEIDAKSKAVLNDQKFQALDELRTLFATAKKSKKQEDMDIALARQNELRPLMEERMKAYKKSKFDFIDANPGSPVAVHIMSYQYSEGRMSNEELKKYYKHFTGEAKETGFYKGYMTKVYKDNFENLGVGNTAPDFTLNTPDNQALTLSEVKGQYILVDFWASWCVPCRASFAHLEELYKKYHKDGFEILGVCTADEDAKWRKALKEDNTPWLHVYDISENHAYGSVAQTYGVPHLPTTFLMDGNREIILRNPSHDELDAKLKEVFGH
ncbi:MAG: AhpC/TSA family protein [Bacteroidales bacterium]|nr:AhpC/TSA family protein [Bacteroidales bacterium]